MFWSASLGAEKLGLFKKESFPLASILNKAASEPPKVRVTSSPSGSEIVAIATPSPATIFSFILTRLSRVINGDTFTPSVKAASLAAASIASAVVVINVVELFKAVKTDESKLFSSSRIVFWYAAI